LAPFTSKNFVLQSNNTPVSDQCQEIWRIPPPGLLGHHQRNRLKDKAAEQYGLFLDLWKDADPNLPEPADAKKRLAALGFN